MFGIKVVRNFERAETSYPEGWIAPRPGVESARRNVAVQFLLEISAPAVIALSEPEGLQALPGIHPEKDAKKLGIKKDLISGAPHQLDSHTSLLLTYLASRANRSGLHCYTKMKICQQGKKRVKLRDD